jgi:hypothetical protein
VLVALRIFAPAVLIADIDAQAAVLAQIVAVVLGYVVQLRVGMAAHDTLSRLRVPVIGMSYTELEFEGEQG